MCPGTLLTSETATGVLTNDRNGVRASSLAPIGGDPARPSERAVRPTTLMRYTLRRSSWTSSSLWSSSWPRLASFSADESRHDGMA